jgi:periplasmic protein CpxP/Spy
MKKLMIGALMSLMALSTFAQRGERVERTLEERAAMRAEKMKTELELSDEQTVKVEAAFLTKMTKSKELRAKYAEDKETQKKEMRQVHAEFKASMKEFLTDEQIAKWNEMKKANHKKAKCHPGKCHKPGEKPQKKPTNRKQNLEVE